MLKFDKKYAIAHQSPPVPLFPIQKIFAFSPSKGVPALSAVGKLLGNPSLKWADLRSLFEYLISDMSKARKKELLVQFRQSKEIIDTKRNNQKLEHLDSAYEFGFRYPKFMLLPKREVCVCLLSLCLFVCLFV